MLADSILRDLLISQSTADSIAPRVNASTDHVTAILLRSELAGNVENIRIQNLTVWRLTASGRILCRTNKNTPTLAAKP